MTNNNLTPKRKKGKKKKAQTFKLRRKMKREKEKTHDKLCKFIGGGGGKKRSLDDHISLRKIQLN